VMRSVRCATRRLFQRTDGAAATSAPGLDGPCHICAGTGRATSAPGLAQRWFGQHLKRHSPQRSMLHRSATQCGQVPHGTGACPDWGALVTQVPRATRGSRVP
jgi:hypothetical protein